MYLSINVSPVQLTAKFVEDVRRQIELYPELSHRLIFEITESSAIEQFDSTFGLLNELRTLGIRIAIDDFGTGYSSLTYLNRLPVDILKLDKGFARLGSINDGPGTEARSNDALIRSVVSLASAIELTVIAEGLESDAMVECFRSAGVELGQGYALANPMDVTVAHEWIRGHAKDADLTFPAATEKLTT